MPRYQDSGHNGQHAFTAFIHFNSPFVRFSLAFHSDPAQYLKTSQPALARRVKARVGRNDAEEVGGSGGGNGDDARLQSGRREVHRRFLRENLGTPVQYCQNNVAYI